MCCRPAADRSHDTRSRAARYFESKHKRRFWAMYASRCSISRCLPMAHAFWLERHSLGLSFLALSRCSRCLFVCCCCSDQNVNPQAMTDDQFQPQPLSFKDRSPMHVDKVSSYNKGSPAAAAVARADDYLTTNDFRSCACLSVAFVGDADVQRSRHVHPQSAHARSAAAGARRQVQQSPRTEGKSLGAIQRSSFSRCSLSLVLMLCAVLCCALRASAVSSSTRKTCRSPTR